MSDLERETAYIDAAEIGEYSYCRRQWWLRRVEGIEPLETARLAQGTAFHQTHWQLVQRAARNRRLLPVLAGALLTLLLLLLLAASGAGG